MLFNSIPFICFIIGTVFLYYIIPKKVQWCFLLIVSYAFYTIADPRYLIFIGVTTVTVWFTSLKVEKINTEQKAYIKEHKSELSKEQKQTYKDKMKSRRWRWLLLCLLLNLGILCVTKYTNFAIRTINDIFSGAAKLKPVDLIVPLGISFYTFQSLSYVIDVYRGKQEAQHNIFKFALFVSFFPQLAQGPISRYGDLGPQLLAQHRFDSRKLSYGAMRIVWGYFKKVIIADRVVTGLTTLTGSTEYTGAYVLCAMFFYALQLYCDFTGGIDITIGIAEAMGIKVTENFKLPYFSKNIKEYWNRWHITMGSWFTDYIFYPISVCGPMLKLSKWSRNHLPAGIGKRVTVYLSCFAVWLATGIWHGAAWNFVAWGLTNYAVIMISQELEPVYAKFHSRFHVKGKAGYEVFQIIRTICLMSAIRMFDCYKDVAQTFKMMWSMISSFRISTFYDGSLMNIGLTASDYAVIAVGFAVVLGVSIIKARKGSVRERVYNRSPLVFYNLMAVMIVAIIVLGAYGVGYDSSQFIYTQF